MGKRQAEAITLDVTSNVYHKQLAQAVSGGELEMADSKAAFLQKLCDELHFDPHKACEIHKGNLFYDLVVFTVSWNIITCNARILNSILMLFIYVILNLKVVAVVFQFCICFHRCCED